MGELLGGDFTGALERWLAGGRVDDAASARSKAHWLGQQLSETASISSMLLDLAESRTQIRLAIVPSSVLVVSVVTVGIDFVIAVDGHGQEHIISIGSIQRIEMAQGKPPIGAQREVAQIGLLEVLALVTEERPEVVVHDRLGSGARGELTRVGLDHVVLRVRESDYRSIVIATNAIARVSTTSK